MRAQAEKGNAAAQFQLGMMYAAGKEITADPAKAVEWLRKAVFWAWPRFWPQRRRMASISDAYFSVI
jgi:hypothetical protein